MYILSFEAYDTADSCVRIIMCYYVKVYAKPDVSRETEPLSLISSIKQRHFITYIASKPKAHYEVIS